MAVDNFIKHVWSTAILRALENQHVAASIASRRYEGEIRQGGERVKINQLGYPTVASYTKNSTSVSPETLVSSQLWLDIDQVNYFAFELDDLDKVQGTPGIFEEATRNSAYSLADTADSYALGLYAQGGISQNSDSSPADINSTNIEEEVLELAEQMDEANIPRQNRFMIIPPWFLNKMVLAGIANQTNNDATYQNGFVQKALGFDLLLSNNVSIGTASTGAQTRIIAGVRGFSYLYAEQLLSVESYRPEDGFADALKGLHVFGGKWIPDRTAVLYADKTDEA